MQGNYKLLRNKNHVGNFTIDSEKNVYEYTAITQEEQPLIFRKALQESNTITGEIPHIWLTNRAPEPNYEFIDALMERVGITKYDPFAFVEYIPVNLTQILII